MAFRNDAKKNCRTVFLVHCEDQSIYGFTIYHFYE